MTGYESKKAAAQDKMVVTDLDGHVVRGMRKQKKVAALDRDAEIERLNEKIEFLARTNMLYSDWEHRDTQVTSDLIRKGIEASKLNAELQAEIERLKEALAQPAQEPIGYAVPTFDFDNSVIKKVHYSGTVPLYTAPPQRPWVGLTVEEIEAIGKPYEEKDRSMQAWGLFACAIEAKLKEKNNG